MYDSRTNYLGTDNRPNVGKGGIIIVPFLDLNCNGRRDKGEPKAFGLNFTINDGRIERDDQDTTIRIFDLEPYVTYTIELDRNSFDNISWQIKKPTISVFIDPNQFKLIQIPIAVVGEVSGTVYLSENNNNKKGQGRIVVRFYRSDDLSLAATTLTEADGFFSYLGLAPGSYIARIDTAQLHRLYMTSSPTTLPVTILQNKDGSVVDGIDFMLQSFKSDTSVLPVKVGEQINVPTEKPLIVEEMVVLPQPAIEEKVVPPPQIIEEKIVPSPSSIISTEGKCIVSYDAIRNGYVLQIASCVTLKKANSVAKKVNNISGLMTFVKAVDIPSLGRRYRVFFGVFKTREEAVAFCLQFNFDL
jgi:hypothetical protein